MKKNLYLLPNEKNVMLKITKATTYLVFIALLLVGSGCKKESNNGVSGGPVVTGFPGCQLIRYDGIPVNYNADGTIFLFGDLTYRYVGNKVILDMGGGELFTFVLDGRKYPTTASYTDGNDSTLLSYTYNSQGYLTQIELVEMVDGAPGEAITVVHEYLNGNRTTTSLLFDGQVESKVTYSYDLTKLDSRKDFFERVFFNLADPNDEFPIYGGKWNTNMMSSMQMESGGDVSTLDIINEFDANGKVINSMFEEDGTSQGSISYFYNCQ
jgi:hypothetical protein